MEMINREILVCECESLEHQFAIWGRQSNYGAFDEIIINPKDAETMIEYLKKLQSKAK